MNYLRVAAALFSLALPAGLIQAQYYQGPPPPPSRGYSPAWDAPPTEFAAMRQRGFRDGIDGARKDYQNHRPPNVYNRDEFRNPHFIPPPDRREYLMGFQRGYQVGMQHIYGPGPYAPRPY